MKYATVTLSPKNEQGEDDRRLPPIAPSPHSILSNVLTFKTGHEQLNIPV